MLFRKKTDFSSVALTVRPRNKSQMEESWVTGDWMEKLSHIFKASWRIMPKSKFASQQNNRSHILMIWDIFLDVNFSKEVSYCMVLGSCCFSMNYVLIFLDYWECQNNIDLDVLSSCLSWV